MKPMGLHVQALVVSAFLILVPFVGVQLVDSHQSVLLENQRSALEEKAAIIAASLGANPTLDFEFPDEGALVAHDVGSWIDVDGRADDWRELNEENADLMIGTNGSDLFLFVRVTDDRVVYSEIGALSIHRNDFVQLATVAPDGNYQRYTITGVQPGPVDASLVAPAAEGSRALRPETRIEAYWLATERGYNVEIRVPVELLTSRFSISVTDVDDPASRQSLGSSGNGSTTDPSKIGQLFLPSTEMRAVLDPFESTRTHLRLEDTHGRLIAKREVLLEPLALTVSWPVTRDGKTLAMLIASESRSAATRLGIESMKRVSEAAALVVLVGIAAMLAFATMLRVRIRRINTNLGQAVDAQGKVRNEMQPLKLNDELGELSRSIAQTTNRLRGYNRYLEEMSRRLAHELRTPVTVIRSSLENMKMGDDRGIYVERAQEGANRLSAILTNMTEATRLEESLRTAEPEYFDLAEVITGCTKGYRIAYPDTTFELSVEGQFERMPGMPDAIAQMLDKLIGNATGFAKPGTAVRIRLTLEGDEAVIRVSNEGPSLPENLEERLFESMISARTDKDGESHLGLGLFVARLVAEYHDGSIAARNREDTSGVTVSVRLPLFRILPDRDAK
jgi:signal transduction histidine kinase